MKINIGTGDNMLLVTNFDHHIGFDTYNSTNNVCSDLSPEQTVVIINELLRCLKIKSKVVTRNRYEIESI